MRIETERSISQLNRLKYCHRQENSPGKEGVGRVREVGEVCGGGGGGGSSRMSTHLRTAL